MSCHTPLLSNLRAQGLRLTAQRSVILEQICHNRGHLTAERIFRLAGRKLPALNIATVYRTLDVLREARLVTAVSTSEGVTAFELTPTDVHHHHLRCRDCGGEWLLPAPAVERLRASIISQQHFHPDLDHLVITGLCASCANRTTRRQSPGD